jgi:hypothetical protein
MQRERKRRWAVVIYMDASAAIVDGWHTRDRAIERLHDYRIDPQFANYLDGMAIVTLDDNAWPYNPRARRHRASRGKLAMISDVLFETRESILGYLAGGLYGEREHRADIAAVVLAMEKLRLSPGYDICRPRENDRPDRRKKIERRGRCLPPSKWAAWRREIPFARV